MHRWAGAAARNRPGTISLLLCHTYPHYSLLMRAGNEMSYLGLDSVQQSANRQLLCRDIAHGNAFSYCSQAVLAHNVRQARVLPEKQPRWWWRWLPLGPPAAGGRAQSGEQHVLQPKGGTEGTLGPQRANFLEQVSLLLAGSSWCCGRLQSTISQP